MLNTKRANLQDRKLVLRVFSHNPTISRPDFVYLYSPRPPNQMLQIFESWGGELSPYDFSMYSLPYLSQIATRVKSALQTQLLPIVPLCIFSKGTWHALPTLSNLSYDVISLDWTIDPEHAKQVTGGRVTLQGNMDPSVLYGSEETIKENVRRMIEAFGSNRKYIVNLGHGILPTVDPENVRIFLEHVHEVGREVAKRGQATSR
jgi:uroporphyrinogen decarboxylase